MKTLYQERMKHIISDVMGQRSDKLHSNSLCLNLCIMFGHNYLFIFIYFFFYLFINFILFLFINYLLWSFKNIFQRYLATIIGLMHDDTGPSKFTTKPRLREIIPTSYQPRSQGLSSSRPLEREKGDPGLVWSRVF